MLAIIGAVLGIIISALFLLGLSVKYILLPWLKENLLKPINETHTQVAVNSFKSEKLTLLDLVHLLGMRLERVEERVDAIERKVDNAAS